MQVSDTSDIPLAIAKAQSKRGATDAPIIIQRVMEGETLRVLGFKRRCEFQAIEVFGETNSPGLYRIAECVSLPSWMPAPSVVRAIDTAREAATRLPSGSYLVEIEVVLTFDQPMVAEIRISDIPNPIQARLLDLAYGIDLYAAVEAINAGKRPDLSARRDMAALCVWLRGHSGKVLSVDGIEAARALYGMAELAIHVKPGDVIRHVTDSAARDRIGYVITVGPTLARAEAAAAAACECVSIRSANILG
jgi:hypothetical protein